MQLPFNLTFNMILMIGIGLSLICCGIWLGLEGDRIFGAGLLFNGIGSLFWGITNGFIDMSPRGQLFYRLGILSFLIGIVIIIYHFSGF
jgi:hypothetical protein